MTNHIRSPYTALALSVALCTGLVTQAACLPRPSPAVQVNVLRAMIVAESAFNEAVTAEQAAKKSGLLAGAAANKADALIFEANKVRKAAEAAERAGLNPDLASFTALIRQITDMTPKGH